MASTKPRLVYFDLRGKAQPIRYLLHFLKVEFEDERIPLDANGFEKWADMKKSEGLDFPNLPFYLGDGELKLSQTYAILRHIGRKYNLYGDTLEEQAKLDMLEQVLHDIQQGAWVVFNDKSFHEIKEDYKKTIPKRLGELELFLEGKNFILGSKISATDFLLYETIEWFRILAPEVFQEDTKLQNLEHFHKRIRNIPEIKEYVESNQFKEWPLFGPVQYFGYSKDPEYKPPPFSFKNWIAKYPLEP